MRSLEHTHPAVAAICLLSVIGTAMLTLNPILLALSLAGGVLYLLLRGRLARGYGLGLVGLFLLLAGLNPLISHNGATVLFVMNDAPITLEALLYGLSSGGAVVTVLLWFRAFTDLMTEDKLLYLLGRLSPKLALVLSMGLRYLPLFTAQAGRVKRAQMALGLYGEDTVFDRLKGGARIASILTTWALENGVTTADSMAARGYGRGRRTHFFLFRFRGRDARLLIAVLLLTALTGWGMGSGGMTPAFYPHFHLADPGGISLIGYAAYGLLCLVPAILEGKEALRWRSSPLRT